MILCAGNAFAQKQEPTQKSDSITVNAAEMADLLISDAMKYLGRPYVWAANGPNAFDCSGFTRFIYSKFGYKLGRTVTTQMTNGRQVKGGLHCLQKGDILVYGSRKDPSRPGHVAIFIELDESKNEFSFIHAASTGVIISKSSETYYRERLLMAVRILPDFVPPAPEAPYTAEQLDTLYSKVDFPEVTDTLAIGAADRRIVLFEDGTWVMVGEDGTIIKPKAEDKDEVVIVYGNGTWKNIPVSEKRIPEKRYDPPTATPAPQTQAPTKKYHTIQSGDTLYKIAGKYNTKVSVICRLNGIKETDILKLGTKLRVKEYEENFCYYNAPCSVFCCKGSKNSRLLGYCKQWL